MDTHLSPLFEHLAWADQTVLKTLEAAESPAPKALQVLAHILIAVHIWLTRMRSEPLGHSGAWGDLTLPECRTLAAENVSGFRALIGSLAEPQLDGSVTYRNLQGIEFQTPLRDILLHIALHGAYHRGQVAAALRLSGVEPPSTDFILFSRQSQTHPGMA